MTAEYRSPAVGFHLLRLLRDLLLIPLSLAVSWRTSASFFAMVQPFN